MFPSLDSPLTNCQLALLARCGGERRNTGRTGNLQRALSQTLDLLAFAGGSSPDLSHGLAQVSPVVGKCGGVLADGPNPDQYKLRIEKKTILQTNTPELTSWSLLFRSQAETCPGRDNDLENKKSFETEAGLRRKIFTFSQQERREATDRKQLVGFNLLRLDSLTLWLGLLGIAATAR